MNPEAQRVRDTFVAAVKLPPDQWEDFLKQACAGDTVLHLQVSELLQAHQRAGSFLDQPVVQVQDTRDFDPDWNGAATAAEDGPSTTIGPYKLLQRIGEGGMGEVWMAEQRQPMHRKVALKIIKAGMDTRQVVARFEAERQALALMDHPNIAKVLDGGTTTGGRPYFVMELVKGTPITRYCDDHRLTVRERLELFLPVCQAIQHAHQKGIIHRDIKPSNVLVAPYDGRPVPKIIDFGVAKATGQRLTERTLYTGFGTVVGTLEYMSPEQAELNNQDIDTRSDIYTLGVLLYELLTGTTPLSHDRVTHAAFVEMLRAIREEEPPRPSARISTVSEEATTISAVRQTDPAKLRRIAAPRPGLDRDEGAGEGPHAAVPDGRRLRARYRAFPPQRACRGQASRACSTAGQMVSSAPARWSGRARRSWASLLVASLVSALSDHRRLQAGEDAAGRGPKQ